ncbi:DUF4881 domain-containing protein [Desulforhabdus amnigena]|uniref:Lipoprotein n=1 Tax=Desulforhabdus amnigena TaxID=40218 RepID=A0A9W6D1I1_9BACT|nr:DUF4881 domain-containing protein [Desulforhabdus amnigena]GLI33249.1 lipoprotein [Desulforhabdus amnigena]
MYKKRSLLLCLLFVIPLFLVAGCSEYGKVDQGRVVKFDKDKKTVTLIQDMKADPQNPDYSHLPAVTYALPTNPNETGAEPKAGLRMKLDTKNRQVVIYDPATRSFKNIDYTLIDEKDNVAKTDELVKDKKFPIVDREKKTITIYSGRQKILVTFSLPEEYFALPDYTWDSGDEVRIYYKEDGKALRFMNISKTDIYKK